MAINCSCSFIHNIKMSASWVLQYVPVTGVSSKGRYPPLPPPIGPPWLLQEMRLVMRSNTLRQQHVCSRAVLVWASKCEWWPELLQCVTAGKHCTREIRRLDEIRAFLAWLSYSSTSYLGAPHSNASCSIYIKSESSSNPSWFGL